MSGGKTVVACIVGMDGCGKSSTLRATLDVLAAGLRVAGVSDEDLSGGPGEPVQARQDIPYSLPGRIAGRVAKSLRWQRLYKNLKLIDLADQARRRDRIVSHGAHDAVLTDGDPLINATAWAISRFYRKELAGADDVLDEVLQYASGERLIPLRQLPGHLRRSWQLVALNRLRLARFRLPDLIILLDIDPAVAMDRIRARGKPLQVHETEQFLAELGAAYARVCRLLHERRGIPLVTIRVDRMDREEAVQMAADAVLNELARGRAAGGIAPAPPGCIDVVATTMSGSIADQLKVGQIGPEFEAKTSRPVRVHLADSHPEAREITREIVTGGGRTIVSAGGAGTFNAVLEGCLVDGAVPPDLRLAFLRKGSADLIGKRLGISNELPAAVAAIVEGIELDRCLDADILTVKAMSPDGREEQRHLVGFGGFEVFGEVPRFTETRLVKLYKGVLGTLFGDLGPFFVGLGLAAVWWRVRLLRGRVSPAVLTIDGEPLPPQTWSAVVVLNGDLGDDFPLGRGLPLGGDSFRVIALPWRGAREAVRQVVAGRTGAIVDAPERYGAVMRTARSLSVRPAVPRPAMVNVDGLRFMTEGEVRVTVTGRVRLVAGRIETGATQSGAG